MNHPTNDNGNYWHVKQTRALHDEHGGERPVTLERCYWAAFDFLSEESHLTGPQILTRAITEAPKQKMAVDTYLGQYIAWLDDQYRDEPGLWNRNTNQPGVVGRIGPVSKQRVDKLQQLKTTTDDN